MFILRVEIGKSDRLMLSCKGKNVLVPILMEWGISCWGHPCVTKTIRGVSYLDTQQKVKGRPTRRLQRVRYDLCGVYTGWNEKELVGIQVRTTSIPKTPHRSKILVRIGKKYWGIQHPKGVHPILKHVENTFFLLT